MSPKTSAFAGIFRDQGTVLMPLVSWGFLVV
jgi:hypothetical protein